MRGVVKVLFTRSKSHADKRPQPGMALTRVGGRCVGDAMAQSAQTIHLSWAMGTAPDQLVIKSSGGLGLGTNGLRTPTGRAAAKFLALETSSPFTDPRQDTHHNWSKAAMHRALAMHSTTPIIAAAWAMIPAVPGISRAAIPWLLQISPGTTAGPVPAANASRIKLPNSTFDTYLVDGAGRGRCPYP
jgi:hypothetical protein